MKEEYGCNKGEGEDEDDEGVTVDSGIVSMGNGEKEKRNTYTLRPTESSV